MCIKQIHEDILYTLLSLPFSTMDCTINDGPPYITLLYDTDIDTETLFTIRLLLLGNTPIIRINVGTNDGHRLFSSIDASGIFETTYIDMFCCLKGINEFREFVNDPLNNTRQL